MRFGARLKKNEKSWDIASQYFYGNSALPKWGPLGIGSDDPAILGPIRGKTFLDIACGSGHSIQHLVQHGAKKVYGLDISKQQILAATHLNQKAIALKRVQLFHTPMEKKLRIPKVDTVYSVYGIGWTLEPTTLFKHVFSYLKPGGRFVWSWDHAMFRSVQFHKGDLMVKGSYFDEREHYVTNWKGNAPVYIAYRTSATWFQLLTNAGFVVTRYLEPKALRYSTRSKDPKRYYSKVKAEKVPMSIIFVCQKPS